MPPSSPASLLRVLLVDDNVDAAETLATCLQLFGMAARTAHDGPAAIAQAQAFRPDAVVLDIGLPGMDGYAVARALRSQAGLGQACLVAVTGWNGADDVRRAQEAGFDHHLAKPVDFGALHALLAQLQPARPGER